MSNASKGAYYKRRTKQWLEGQGYAVALLERVMWIPPKQPGDRPIPVKHDQFGSDLLAMSAEELIFIQVKGGARARSNASAGRREFAKHAFPAFTKRWVVVWEPRHREPQIIDCGPA